MPFVHTTTSAKLSDAQRAHLSKAFRAACRDELGKPEQYVMTAFNDDTPIEFQGSTEPAACIRVEILGTYASGAPAKVTPKLSAAVTKEAGIPANRVYVMYYCTPHVGYDGSNF